MGNTAVAFGIQKRERNDDEEDRGEREGDEKKGGEEALIS